MDFAIQQVSWYALCKYHSMNAASKRLVLHHATGRLAGLYQILGIAPSAQDYPPSLDYGKGQQANHAATKPRYIAYREWSQTPTGKLNDFNPAQV